MASLLLFCLYVFKSSYTMAQDIFLRPAAVKIYIYIYQTFNSCSIAHLAFKTCHFFPPFKEDKGKDRWEFKNRKHAWSGYLQWKGFHLEKNVTLRHGSVLLIYLADKQGCISERKEPRLQSCAHLPMNSEPPTFKETHTGSGFTSPMAF